MPPWTTGTSRKVSRCPCTVTGSRPASNAQRPREGRVEAHGEGAVRSSGLEEEDVVVAGMPAQSRALVYSPDRTITTVCAQPTTSTGQNAFE